MSRTIIAAAAISLLAGPALAEPTPAPAPAVLLLPVKSIVALRQYLGTRPYDETAGIIAGIEACAQVQIPSDGATRSSGQCPEVMWAMRAREEAKPRPSSPDVPAK